MLTDPHLPAPASSVLACHTLERAVVVGTGLAIACEAALLYTLLAGPRLLQDGLALSVCLISRIWRARAHVRSKVEIFLSTNSRHQFE